MTRAKRCFAALVMTAGCVAGGAAALTPHERAVVDEWLICIECDVVLDSLRALGVRKPASTIDALNHALLSGPPGQSIFSAESALAVSFRRDSNYSARTGLGLVPARAAYITEQREKYRNGYRARGATGLGWIGTPAAKLRLDSAATLSLPESVKRAVTFARDSLP